jgi:MoxR-like ATPase
MIPESIEALAAALEGQNYQADRALQVALHLSLQMGKPLFLEGEPGVGKTEVAKVLSAVTGGELIRLQCYEGLDVSHAMYEWDYARQMLAIRLAESSGDSSTVTDVMSRDFLVARPLLKAIEASVNGNRPVLLIDEIDRADEEFEAFLLELLSDFQITIPEIGTIKAETPPIVILTSNRTREIHDALKRRCIYHWIDYPTYEREMAIIHAKVPGISAGLAEQLANAMQHLRSRDLFKPPGVAETLDWATALKLLGADELTPELYEDTLGVVLKYQDDLDVARAIEAADLLSG